MKTIILWGIALLTILYIPLKAQRLPISTPTEAEATPDPTTSWEAREAKWTEFAQIDGRFSVRTPGPLQMKADTVETALGEMVYHTYFFQPQEDLRENEVYMLSYVDYPEGSLHHDSTELVQELLAETLAAATESVDGEVLFQREGKQQDFPYQYWRIDYLGGRASIRTKAIVARNRFYTIQTVSRREWGMNNSTDRFIDSFRVF